MNDNPGCGERIGEVILGLLFLFMLVWFLLPGLLAMLAPGPIG